MIDTIIYFIFLATLKFNEYFYIVIRISLKINVSINIKINFFVNSINMEEIFFSFKLGHYLQIFHLKYFSNIYN